MKVVFTVTDRDPDYLKMAQVLVITAKVNSNVDLYCLYDGQINEFTTWLNKWDVSCIPWRISFAEEIKKKYTGKKSVDYCIGAYLCLEISQAFRAYDINDQYVLYVDVDIMILKEILLDNTRPACFAAPPDWNISDWSFSSAGVMVLNLNRAERDYSSFVEYLSNHNFDFAFAGHGPCSQGAWNTFYKDQWERLDPIYDWKPWWGFNPNARIVHFSGPKPCEIETFLVDNNKTIETERQKINRFVIERAPDVYREYLQIWRKYEKLVTE